MRPLDCIYFVNELFVSMRTHAKCILRQKWPDNLVSRLTRECTAQTTIHVSTHSTYWQSNHINFHTLSISIILSCRLRCRRQGNPLLSRYTHSLRLQTSNATEAKMQATKIKTTPMNEWKRTNLRLVVLTKQANHQRSFNDSRRNGTLRLMCKSPSSASVLFFIHTDQHCALHY